MRLQHTRLILIMIEYPYYGIQVIGTEPHPHINKYIKYTISE